MWGAGQRSVAINAGNEVVRVYSSLGGAVTSFHVHGSTTDRCANARYVLLELTKQCRVDERAQCDPVSIE